MPLPFILTPFILETPKANKLAHSMFPAHAVTLNLGGELGFDSKNCTPDSVSPENSLQEVRIESEELVRVLNIVAGINRVYIFLNLGSSTNTILQHLMPLQG